MTIIGIDPGLDGGIATLRDEDVSVVPMPTMGTKKRVLNAVFITQCLRWNKGAHLIVEVDLHVFIERQQSMPKQGIASTHTNGMNYGILVGICVGLGIPYTIVPAKEWQKVMFSGLGTIRKTPKAASIMRAKQLFPDTSLKKTERCKKDHDGMADALLIAEFGRRTLK